MVIKSSVGVGGNNNPQDVKFIQAALNLAITPHYTLKNKLAVDGQAGRKTYKAIVDFQKSVVCLENIDGRIDPAGLTLSTLAKNVKGDFSKDMLSAVMAQGTQNTIDAYYPLLIKGFIKYNITTPLRVAHFLAQIGHESLSLIYTEEIASGAAYEGRKDLGNIEKGDGKRFKGRGLIQLTGRSNYTAYSDYAGVDLLNSGNEKIVSERPYYALDVSLWFWEKNKLNIYADKNDIKAVTRRVNGGYNGLQDRIEYLQKALFFLEY